MILAQLRIMPKHIYFGSYLYLKSILALISAWLMLVYPSVHAAECPNAVSPEQATVRLNMIGIAYPEGKTFEQWLERKDSKISCELFKRLGWSVDISYLPLRRAFAAMAMGKYDMMSGTDYVFTPEVRCHLKLIPYRHYRLSAFYFAKKRHFNEPKQIVDFEAKNLAILAGSNEADMILKKAGIDANLHQSANHETQFHLLRLGRIDYAFISTNGAKEITQRLKLIDHNNDGQFFEVATALDIQRSGVVFNLKRQNIETMTAIFEAAFKQLRNEAFFKQLIEDDSVYLSGKPALSMVEKYSRRQAQDSSSVCHKQLEE